MISDPARPLALAIAHEDEAADRLAHALHALAEAEEALDEDAQDADLAARIAAAQAAADRADAARDAATAERQRLERELAADDPAALRRAYGHLLPPRQEPGRPERRVRERAGVAALRYGDDDGDAPRRRDLPPEGELADDGVDDPYR